MFELNDVIHVFSPTGASAHNAGGKTFYQGGAIKVWNVDWETTTKQEEHLQDWYLRDSSSFPGWEIRWN